MRRNTEEHARYSVYLRTFCALKKNGNRAISLRNIEEWYPKRADSILSYMQEAMYGRGAIFHGTGTDDGVGWYLRPEIYAMSSAEFIENYKSTHSK